MIIAKRSRLLVYLFIGITFMFGTLAQEAGAVTYYVPTPDYTTIQGCIDAAVDNDICMVQPGTYAENLIITKGITVRSTSGAADTIIDGTNSGRVVQFLTEAGDGVLDGFTIINGSAPNGSGGGIYIEEADPLIINCVIKWNSALTGGGIAAYLYASITVESSFITENNATGTLNSGIEQSCLSPDFSFTQEGGGGMSIDCLSYATIIYSTISNNIAVGNGGGIRSTFSAINNQLTFVTGNESQASGGGIHSRDTQYKDFFNLVAGNTANTGGGIYFVGSPGDFLEIVHSTITDNTANTGGGLYAQLDTTATIVNTILYGNSSLPVFGTGTCINYSDIEGGFAGEGNIDEDPSFVDAPNGNYDLNSDSPAIDAGVNNPNPPCIPITSQLALPTEDIAGRTRPQGASYDMGAYETFRRGDCNGDELVDAGDISALVLEVFDGDGNLPAGTPGGTFTGNPAGCDANEDLVVDAGDLTCTVLLIFNGQGACGAPAAASAMSASYQAAATGPALDIPVQIEPNPDGTVTVPVNFSSDGNGISAAVFSVDYDETLLSFDPADNDQDGLPDAVTFNINPFTFFPGITFDPGDTDGELDFNISDVSTPLASLPDGLLVSITLNVGSPSSTTEASVNFSQDPLASFGDTTGQSVAGTTSDGSVLITVEDTCSQYSKRGDCNNDPNCEWVGGGKNGTCQAVQSCTPTSSDEVGLCGDGIDNDCDGVADCDDTDDCAADPVCQQPADCSVNSDQSTCEADPDCRWKKKQQVCVNR